MRWFDQELGGRYLAQRGCRLRNIIASFNEHEILEERGMSEDDKPMPRQPSNQSHNQGPGFGWLFLVATTLDGYGRARV